MFERLQFPSSTKANDSNNHRSKNDFFQPGLFGNNVDEQEANSVGDKIANNYSALNSFFTPPIQANSGISSCGPENYMEKMSGGNSLNAPEKSFFESKMNYDFSNVRIHNDSNANESAKNINALAYTHGNNIVFASGQYQPATHEGKKLLAHELVHVVQNKEHTNTTIKRKEFKSTGRANEETPELINETVINSSLLAKYVGADRIKAAFLNSDNFHVIQKYELEEYGKKCEQGDIVDKAGGFFCRNVKDAKDKNLRGDIFVVRYLKLGYVIHEFMHKLSGPTVKNFLGVFINEGVTQYFTDLFLKEGKYEILTDHGYGDNLACAKKIISKTGEDTVAKAYFNNETKLISDLQKLLGLKSFNDVNPYFKDHKCIPEEHK